MRTFFLWSAISSIVTAYFISLFQLVTSIIPLTLASLVPLVIVADLIYAILTVKKPIVCTTSFLPKPFHPSKKMATDILKSHDMSLLPKLAEALCQHGYDDVSTLNHFRTCQAKYYCPVLDNFVQSHHDIRSLIKNITCRKNIIKFYLHCANDCLKISSDDATKELAHKTIQLLNEQLQQPAEPAHSVHHHSAINIALQTVDAYACHEGTEAARQRKLEEYTSYLLSL